MANLLIERGGRAVGPFTQDEVRRYLAKGHLQPQTLAWTEGLVDWAPLDQVLPRAAGYPNDGDAPFTDTAGRSILPDEARGFSWGAFFCGPLWGFPYRIWVSILALVPGIGALVWLWMGFNGREMAWRAREWDSVQTFLKSERRWTRVGLVLFWLIALVPIGLALWVYSQRGVAANLPAPAGTAQPQAPAAPQGTAPRRAAPTQQDPPAAEPAAPANPAAGAPSNLRSRAAWRKQLVGMRAAQVRAALGDPAHTQRLEDKGVDVWIYPGMSYERRASEPDAFMLLGLRNGAVAAVEFAKKEQP